MKKKGFDVTLWGASAFSTLGFFSDPLYLYMELYSEYELAQVIIHEEVHATLFLKKYPDFNEQFASFIGETGAYLFIEKKYGSSEAQKQLEQTIIKEKDIKQFTADMIELGNVLRILYTSDKTDYEKRTEKAVIIQSFQNSFAKTYDEKYATEMYCSFSKSKNVNNASIAKYMLYQENNFVFSNAYMCFTQKYMNRVSGDMLLKEFIARIVVKAEKEKDPWNLFEDFCSES